MDSATTTSVETTAVLTATHQRAEKQTAPPTSKLTNGNGKTFIKKYRHVAAVHSQSRPSTLSHESTAAPSFVGFRNLMVIVLVVGNVRLIIENIQKYGNLICLTCHDFRRQDLVLGLGLYFLIPCFLWVAHTIELFAARQAKVSKAQSVNRGGSTSPTPDQQRTFKAMWRIIRWAHGINATLALSITSWVVYHHIHHPGIGTATEIHAIIVWLKTASYALTNRDLRHAYLHPVKGELAAVPEIYASCPYPQNITMKNLAYFWWAPTLVYQPVYPRNDKIRWSFVFKRVGETICLSVFIWFCAAQYASPTLRNSVDKIYAMDVGHILERLLKLAPISLVIWLAGFFAVFQSVLNALAEVMRFADRAFYLDWWNATSLGDYWKLWNKPVNSFMRRHVFTPMMGRGYGRHVSMLAVFFISAVLHELAVGVPTHSILGKDPVCISTVMSNSVEGVAFFGMMFQIVLIALTEWLPKRLGDDYGKLSGNVLFWVSFTIIGQPACVMIYFFAWQAKFGSVSKLPAGHISSP